LSAFIAAHRRLLPMARLAKMLGVSRPTAYRPAPQPTPLELGVKAAMRRIALPWPCYGYRPMLHELRDLGFAVGERRVRRFMREEQLARRRRRKGPRYRPHGLAVYPNLAADFVPTGINQLWSADFTYVHLQSQFVYAAVIVDEFSRREVGWAVEATRDGDLTLRALHMALERRDPPPGLIHHSDRGRQYAAEAYVQLLNRRGIKVSMSRAGKPTDNATCERLIRTLKTEEIYLKEYEDLADVRRNVGHFFETIYNHKRRHSALGYLSPAEFERRLLTQEPVGDPV
jgi:putative transposase